jgi:hypothetical protein
MIKKIALLVIISILLVGCGKETVYRDKKVPVYMVPAPPTIEQPELPIHSLDFDWSSPENIIENMGKIVQAYVISIRLLINWGEANNEIVEAYRDMSERDFSVDPITFAMAGPNATTSDIEELEIDSESDYGTIDRFARRKFNEIEDKYHQENQLILQSYNNETESDQDD